MPKKALELLLLVFAIAMGAHMVHRPVTKTEDMSSTPAPPEPRQAELAVGRVRCVAVLENKRARLRFDNPGPGDMIVPAGRHARNHELLRASPQKLVFRAGYQDCSLDSIHDCFHYTGLRVPAGASAWLDLGHRPQELTGLSGEIAAEYLTQAPGSQRAIKGLNR